MSLQIKISVKPVNSEFRIVDKNYEFSTNEAMATKYYHPALISDFAYHPLGIQEFYTFPHHSHTKRRSKILSAVKKVNVCFNIAQYPVRWTAQSALHFSSPGRPVHSGTNSTSPGSILAMQQLRAKNIHSYFHHCM